MKTILVVAARAGSHGAIATSSPTARVFAGYLRREEPAVAI
jgi:hypothetical protein